MKTSIEKLNLIAKVLKIVATVIFWCCLVGAALCVLALILTVVGLGTIKLGGVTLIALIESEAGVSLGIPALCVSCVFTAIVLVAQAIAAKMCAMHFSKYLDVGTPFDFSIANDMKRLGIALIIIGALSSLLNGISFALLEFLSDAAVDSASTLGNSNIGLGILFLLLCLVLRYGAELRQSNND